MTVIEYDINRLVWNLVSQGLKPHKREFIWTGGGHGEPEMQVPVACDKWVDKVSGNTIERLGQLDHSKECTCGADKHNQMLRDMADELLNLINAKQAVR